MHFLWTIIAAIFGAHYLPHARLTGALTILGGTGYQRGVESNETGINIESFSVRYFPRVNEYLADKGGEDFLNARSAKFSREISLAGEVSGATGVMALTLTAAITVLANDIATFGDGSGSVILDEVSEEQSRDGWRRISMQLSSRPTLVIS